MKKAFQKEVQKAFQRMLKDKAFMSLALVPLVLLMCIYIAVHSLGQRELAEQLRVYGIIIITLIGFIFVGGEKITLKIKSWRK